jgi:F-type H+-transporting ATPase subunit epsilon
MKTFPLSMISPLGSLFDGEVQFVTVPGFDGSMGVLAGHAPILTTLRAGVVKLTASSGEETFYAIASGILEVNQSSQALILADEAVKAASQQEADEKLKEIKTRYGTAVSR